MKTFTQNIFFYVLLLYTPVMNNPKCVFCLRTQRSLKCAAVEERLRGACIEPGLAAPECIINPDSPCDRSPASSEGMKLHCDIVAGP